MKLAAALTVALVAASGRIDTVAVVDHPRGLAVVGGGILVAAPFANVVRLVGADGTVSTVAGTGAAGFSGDGGPATAARLSFVHGAAAMPDGGYVLADLGNERIRRVRRDGTIVTVAGTGVRGFAGDGGPATAAELADPRGVATFPDGRILIPDTGNDRVRLVRLDGTIVTVAGNGVRGFAGDGGPATSAALNQPFGVAPLPDGGFLVDDSGNDRIRLVSPSGRIATVAGTGTRGFSGDGGPATSAELNGAHNLAPLADGFLIADTFNDRIRLVRDGTITTLAGSRVRGFGGDGGPATAAELDRPKAVAVTADGAVLVGDSENDRVRRVDAGLRPVPPFVLRLRTKRVRASRPARIAFTANAPGTVVLRVRRERRLVLAVSGRARAGSSTLVIRRRLRRGAYRLELRGRRGDGAAARVAGRLTVA